MAIFFYNMGVFRPRDSSRVPCKRVICSKTKTDFFGLATRVVGCTTASVRSRCRDRAKCARKSVNRNHRNRRRFQPFIAISGRGEPPLGSQRPDAALTGYRLRSHGSVALWIRWDHAVSGQGGGAVGRSRRNDWRRRRTRAPARGTSAIS